MCKLEKELLLFPKNKSKSDGFDIYCKECNSAKSKINRDHNPEYNKKYKEGNKEKCREYSKKYRDNNKELVKIRKNNSYNKKKDYYSEMSKLYKNNRMSLDPLYKLYINTSSLIRVSFNRNGYSKKSRTYEILGCSFEDFRLYLESKFEDWMSWENRGKYNGEFNYGWDIDHIIPISSANSEDDVIRLNHYTNLQPLCSKVNRDIKIDKLY
jgi:hypothetical protein